MKITEVEEVIYKDNTIDMEDTQISDNPEPIDILDADIYKVDLHFFIHKSVNVIK